MEKITEYNNYTLVNITLEETDTTYFKNQMRPTMSKQIRNSLEISNINTITFSITNCSKEVTTNNNNLPKDTPEWLERVGCVNGKKNTSSPIYIGAGSKSFSPENGIFDF